MDWLNYHHLLYFWRVAALGSVSAAAQELRLRQPTISAQIAALEDKLAKKLFERRGKRLELTEDGHIAMRYAEEIFSMGRELSDVLNDRPAGRPLKCVVGIVDVVPKLIAYQFLRPVLELPESGCLECREDDAPSLLSLLASHKLDLVISDSPIPSGLNLKGYNHLMGETSVAFFAREDLARRLRRNFPASLDGQNILLPLSGSALRRSIERWMNDKNVRPSIVGEFEDSALMKSFGEAGYGVFPAPLAISKEIEQRYKVKLIRVVPEIVERFYAISQARRIRNPLIDAIVSNSKEFLKRR